MAKIRILNARYGAADQWADVTKIVRDLAEKDRLVLGVGNGTLGGDAAPNLAKALELEWRIGRGPRSHASFPEGSTVEIP